MPFCIRESEYNPTIHKKISGPSNTCQGCGLPTPAGSPVHVPVTEQTSSRIGVTIIFEEVVEEGNTSVEIFGYNDAENVNFNWEIDAQYLGNVILEFKLPESYTLEDFGNFRVFDTVYYSDSSFEILDITISEGQYAPDFATKRVYGLLRGGEVVLSALATSQDKGKSGAAKKNNGSVYPGIGGGCEPGQSTCCLPSLFTVYGDCSCMDCKTADDPPRQSGTVVKDVSGENDWTRTYKCECKCKDYMCAGGCKTSGDFNCGPAVFEPKDCRCECEAGKLCRRDDGSAKCAQCSLGLNYDFDEDCNCTCGGRDKDSYEVIACGGANRCVSKCGDKYQRNLSTCGCDCKGDENGNPCGENEEAYGPPCGCRCKSGFERCKGQCVQECGNLEKRNTETCACECDDSLTCDEGKSRSKENGCECRCTNVTPCPPDKEWDDYTCKCECKPDSCECNKGPCPSPKVYGKFTDGCPCLCPEGAASECINSSGSWDSDTCECKCRDMIFEGAPAPGNRDENGDCRYSVECWRCGDDGPVRQTAKLSFQQIDNRSSCSAWGQQVGYDLYGSPGAAEEGCPSPTPTPTPSPTPTPYPPIENPPRKTNIIW